MNNNHLLPPEKDYTPAIEVARQADINFIKKHGYRACLDEWDAALEKAVEDYNTQHRTNYDPVEARLIYVEQQPFTACG